MSQDSAPVGRADRTLFWILRYELRRVIRGRRYRVSTPIIIFLLVSSAVVHAMRFQADTRSHEAQVARYEAGLESATIDRAVSMRHPATKQPWKLAFAIDGDQTGKLMTYSQAPSALVAPELTTTGLTNYRLESAFTMDWLFVVTVVMAFATFVLAHDMVAGQRDLLRRTLAYPVAAWQVLAGKFLAIWSSLCAPFLVGSALSGLVLFTYGGLRFSQQELSKLAGVCFLAVWAIGLFALLALLVSARAESPATSLLVLSLIWTASVTVVPAAGGLIAHTLSPLPTKAEIDTRLATIDRLVAMRFGGQQARWRRRQWAEDDGFVWERLSARAQNLRRTLNDEVHRGLLESKLEQVELGTQLSLVSPTALVQTVGAHWVGTGTERERSFLEQAWAFGDVLEHYFETEDRADPASPHIHFFTQYMSQRPLDAATLPRFEQREIGLRAGFLRGLPAMVLLFAETVLLALAAMVAFRRHATGNAQ